MSKTNIGSYLTSFDGPSFGGLVGPVFFKKLIGYKLCPCVKVTDWSPRFVDFMLNYSFNNP